MNQSNSMKDLIENVREGEATVFTVTEKLRSDGKTKEPTLRVERVRLPDEQEPERPKKEAGRRGHGFFRLADFIAYLAKYGAQDQICALAHPADRMIRAVLDESTAVEPEVLSYSPMQSAEWKRFLELLAGLYPPKAFAKLMRTMRTMIVEPDPRDLLLATRQLSVAKDVEEIAGSGTDVADGIIVKLKATSGAAEAATIPDRFVVELRPFVDSPEPQRFEVFVDLTLDRNDRPVFDLSCPEVEHVYEAHFIAATDKLASELSSKGALVGLGAMTRADWRYRTIG